MIHYGIVGALLNRIGMLRRITKVSWPIKFELGVRNGPIIVMKLSNYS